MSTFIYLLSSSSFTTFTSASSSTQSTKTVRLAECAAHRVVNLLNFRQSLLSKTHLISSDQMLNLRYE